MNKEITKSSQLTDIMIDNMSISELKDFQRNECDLEGLPEVFARILESTSTGRTVVRVDPDAGWRQLSGDDFWYIYPEVAILCRA